MDPRLPPGVQPGGQRRRPERRLAGSQDPRGAASPTPASGWSCPFVANAYHLSDAVVADVVEVAATSREADLRRLGLADGTEAGLPRRAVRGAGRSVPHLRQCVDGLARATSTTTRPGGATGRPDGPAGRRGRHRRLRPAVDLPAGVALSELESKRLLAAYGIPVSRRLWPRAWPRPGGRRRSSGTRSSSRSCPGTSRHKSDLGLGPGRAVVAGGGRSARLRRADAGPSRGPAGRRRGGARVRSWPAGIETVVGLTHDSVFGPTVMFGLGGGACRDPGRRQLPGPPFPASEARSMIEEIRGARLL